jgi:indolepyruvate ferredoxin oxidoreductase
VPSPGDGYDLLVTGVGGTGVITVGQLVTMAAHLEGRGASVLDFTGFAQKFGTVLSYIRLAEEPWQLNQVRIENGQADALIGCDLVVSSSPKASGTYRPGHTRAVLNTAEMSTADFVKFRDANLNARERIEAIARVVGRENLSTVSANRLAEKLLGNTIYANVLMLGFSWQRGLVPVSAPAILRAIELNGVDVDRNKEAFAWGRIAAADRAYIETLLERPERVEKETLESLVERHVAFLRDYQDDALATRFRRLVDEARDRERTLCASGDLPFTRTLARAYFKTLAYKDEYEVARLHVDTGFLERIREEYGDAARVRFHLAPPVLNREVDARGRPRKREFGGWMIPVFRVLAAMRRLRGTKLDVFGMTAERRLERDLIAEFEVTAKTLLERLDAGNIDTATGILALFLEIRGYGPVKSQAAAETLPKIRQALAEFGLRQAA